MDIPQRHVPPCVVDEGPVAGVSLREPAVQRTAAHVQITRYVLLRNLARSHPLKERGPKARDYIRFIQTGKLLDKDAVMGCCKVAVPGRKWMVGVGMADEQAVGIRAE